MLQETTKIYELNRWDYTLFYKDIVSLEYEKGYVLTDEKYNPKNDRYVLTFDYKDKITTHYDLIVKWNNEKTEKTWKRDLTLQELTKEMKTLLDNKTLHFVNPKCYKIYPEYIKVE